MRDTYCSYIYRYMHMYVYYIGVTKFQAIFGWFGVYWKNRRETAGQSHGSFLFLLNKYVDAVASVERLLGPTYFRLPGAKLRRCTENL